MTDNVHAPQLNLHPCDACDSINTHTEVGTDVPVTPGGSKGVVVIVCDGCSHEASIPFTPGAVFGEE
jgi:hypothetical protein